MVTECPWVQTLILGKGHISEDGMTAHCKSGTLRTVLVGTRASKLLWRTPASAVRSQRCVLPGPTIHSRVYSWRRHKMSPSSQRPPWKPHRYPAAGESTEQGATFAGQDCAEQQHQWTRGLCVLQVDGSQTQCQVTETGTSREHAE